MQQLETWFNSPRGHYILGIAFASAAQAFPQYAAVLNPFAAAFAYGGIVAGSPGVAPAAVLPKAVLS